MLGGCVGTAGFEGLGRGRDNDDAVELELIDCVLRREQVAYVGWIEAPAENGKAHRSVTGGRRGAPV